MASRDGDQRWLAAAVELSRAAPVGPRYRVGAVIVDAAGDLVATGHTGQHDPAEHAEEAALAAVSSGAAARLPGASLYSSLEPCATRASRLLCCAELIVRAGITRVVFAWREPPLLAPGGGADLLRAAGVTVVERPELAGRAQQVNAHLLDGVGRAPKAGR